MVAAVASGSGMMKELFHPLSRNPVNASLV